MRVLAAVIDLAVTLLLTGLLASSTGRFFAERAVVTFRVYSPDSHWNGMVPLVLGAISSVSYGFAFALILVLISEVAWGVSAGKSLVGRRVVNARGEPVRAGQLWLRFAWKTSPWWVFCGALLAGRWELAAVAALLAVLFLVDLTVALIAGRRLGHDRLAGIPVVANP